MCLEKGKRSLRYIFWWIYDNINIRINRNEWYKNILWSFSFEVKFGKITFCKWKILHPTIDSMFRAPCDDILIMLFKKAINDCNGNTTCVSTIVQLMEKKCYWVSYNIDNVEGTFGLCGSSRSESNHSNVKNLYLRIWKTFMVLCNNWWADNTNWCYKIKKLYWNNI